MATEFFKSAILKINEEQNIDALILLQKAEYQATEGMYLSPCFQSLLKCVKIKMSCGALIETAVEMQGTEQDPVIYHLITCCRYFVFSSYRLSP